MRHLRMVGVCLVAVFAMTAIAATSASALPEFGQCYVQAKHEGKYATNNCTTKAKVVNTKPTGGFEWRKANEVANRKFTGVGGAGVLVTTLIACVRGDQEINPSCEKGVEKEARLGPIKVECETENAGGEVSVKGEIKNVVVKFHNCKFGGSSCSNAAEGEIVVNVLKGKLGYISKAKKEVGIQLNPVAAKGEFAKFTCAGTITTVVGVGPSKSGTTTLKCVYPEPHCGGDGIISPVTPVNVMTPTLTQVYTVNAAEENVPSHFEGKPIELLEDFAYNNGEPEYLTAWGKSGEEITNVNTGAEEVEIKA
jgi:hypothetical protein